MSGGDPGPIPHASAGPLTRAITLRELAWTAVGLTVLTALFLWPLVRSINTAMPENPADARLNAWALAWGADRLPHGLRGFWNPPIYYPYPDALAYIENLLGITILVAPVTWIWGNPILTYNVALLLSFVTSALGGYLLAREVTGRRDAALVTACAFGFAPYRWAQLPHLQVLFVGWLPLALWALHRTFRTGSWIMAAACAAAVVLQALANSYAAFQAGVAMAIMAGWLAITDRAARARIVRLAAIGLIGAVLMLPALSAYYRAWSGRAVTPGDLTRYSADLGSYLDVAPGLPLAGRLPGVARDEGRLFPGLVVVAFAVLAFTPLARRLPGGRWRWMYVAIAVAAIVISLGPQPRAWHRALPISAIYAALLKAVPLFDALRVPARFGMLALLAGAVLAGIGMAALGARLPPRRAWAVAAAACAVILFEGYGGPLAVQTTGLTRAPWSGGDYAWLAGQPPGAALHLPIAAVGNVGRSLQHQFATLVHRHPIVNGVSRRHPPLPRFLAGSSSPLLDPDALAELVPFLQGLQVRYVLVRPEDFGDAETARRLIDALDRSQHVQLAARVEGVLAYVIELQPDTSAGADGLARIPPGAFRITASDAADRIGLAVDGNVDTRWMSGRPQDGTEWIALDFALPRAVARLEFVIEDRSLNDYPRQIEIAASATRAGEPESILFRGSMLPALGRGFLRSPARPIVSIDLTPFSTARLVIRQRGRTRSWYWSIHELTVWEYAAARDAPAAPASPR